MGENASNAAGGTSDDGNGMGLRLGYGSGPFNVALGMSRTKYAAGDVQQNNIGGQWDFGVARLMGHISRDQNGTVDGRGWLLGALVPVGPGEIRAAFSRYSTDAAGSPGTRKISLGYVHNLSKRTAVYTTYARLQNKGGATQALNGAVVSANSSSSGFDLGLRHSF